MTDKVATLKSVCDAVAAGTLDVAVSRLKRDYPFVPAVATKRRYGPMESTRIFVRDGFIDRYSGDRLVFPPVLRLLSVVLPADFPYQANWRTDSTHIRAWDGLLGWFREYVGSHAGVTRPAWLRAWRRAAESAVRSI